MKDVNCKNWSSKFSFGRRGSQPLCSEGSELTGAGFQFGFNPRKASFPSFFRKEAQEQGGMWRTGGTGEQDRQPAILIN